MEAIREDRTPNFYFMQYELATWSIQNLLLIPDFALMSYACVVEPLRAANLLADREIYRWVHVSSQEKSVTASCGATVPCAATIRNVGKLDLLLVCAGGEPAGFKDAATLAWLRRTEKNLGWFSALKPLLGIPYLRTLIFTLGYVAVAGIFWEFVK